MSPILRRWQRDIMRAGDPRFVPLTLQDAEVILATGRPLTHEERLRLEPARVICRTVVPGGTWGGIYIKPDGLPIEGRKRYVPTPEDEALYLKLWTEEGI